MLTDYVMEDAEIQEKSKQIVLQALQQYSKTEDYKLLLNYDPEFANGLIRPDLNLEFGAAPLLQVASLTGIAWGETYHYSSYDHSRVADANVKTSFESDLRVFLFNSDHVSHATVKKAFKVFGTDNTSLPIVDATERGLKYLSKSAGENALENLVRGWDNLYVTLHHCTDLALNEKSEKAYLYVNPVYASVYSGKKETKKLIGYLVAKDDLHFEVENLGGDAGMAAYLKSKKKKIRTGILIGAGVLCVAAIILTLILI